MDAKGLKAKGPAGDEAKWSRNGEKGREKARGRDKSSKKTRKAR